MHYFFNKLRGIAQNIVPLQRYNSFKATNYILSHRIVMRKGLVLEGGGMRGLFTAGILDVMMEHGISVDGVVGVSAGALFGCNYVSRQPGRALRYNLRFRKDPRYMGWRTLWRTGNIVSPDFAYHTLPNELDIFDYETFNNSNTKFYLVATDAERGIPIYHKLECMDDNAMEWMRASASMPIVSQAVEVDGLKLLDGGITDSIPLKYFQSLGYTRNIVILTQPKGYFKKQTKLMPLFHLLSSNYPQIIRCMAQRHIMYNNELLYIAQEESKGNIIVLCPEKPLRIGRTEQTAHKMQAVYDMGRDCATQNIDRLKDFLR